MMDGLKTLVVPSENPLEKLLSFYVPNIFSERQVKLLHTSKVRLQYRHRVRESIFHFSCYCYFQGVLEFTTSLINAVETEIPQAKGAADGDTHGDVTGGLTLVP